MKSVGVPGKGLRSLYRILTKLNQITMGVEKKKQRYLRKYVIGEDSFRRTKIELGLFQRVAGFGFNLNLWIFPNTGNSFKRSHENL